MPGKQLIGACGTAEASSPASDRPPASEAGSPVTGGDMPLHATSISSSVSVSHTITG